MNGSNPYMLILNANPAKYIKTPSSTVVTLIKVLEGVLSFLLCFRYFSYLYQLISGNFEIKAPFLGEYIALPDNLNILPISLPGGETTWRVLCGSCILIILICTVIEAVLIIILRFVMKGAKALVITQLIIVCAKAILAVCTLLFAALLFYGAVTKGLDPYKILMGFGGNLSELIPSAVMFGCSLLLFLWVSYHRGIIKVLSAVKYEIKLGFKETTKQKTRLTRDSILLGILFLAATALCIKIRWPDINIYLAAVLAAFSVKYFAVYNCWAQFQLCHR